MPPRPILSTMRYLPSVLPTIGAAKDSTVEWRMGHARRTAVALVLLLATAHAAQAKTFGWKATGKGGAHKVRVAGKSFGRSVHVPGP